MKVAVIATVLNEIDAIRGFLDGLVSQSRPADEIVIVDGGSTDGTAGCLALRAKENPTIRILLEPGCNVARGRNIAIRNSSCEIIAMTDAGTRLDRQWLEQLVGPFERGEDADVVGGWVAYAPETRFEEWLSLLNRPFESLDAGECLPSARSLALKRSCWESVGGFPEDLSMWAEDTVFLLRLKRRGFRIAMTSAAGAFWRPRRNLREFARQYLEYGIGDGEARLYPMLYVKRLVLLAGVISLAAGAGRSALLTVCSVLVLGTAFFRIVYPLKRPSVPAWKLLPLFALVLIMELSQLFGYAAGRLRRRSVNA